MDNMLNFDEDKYDLNRFIRSQQCSFDTALKEIKNECKITHWMWYIFPQIDGLGMSEMSRYYSIKFREELDAYMDNDYLRNNILKVSETLLTLQTNNAVLVFDIIDSLKLRSSMTLFAEAFPEYKVFQKVLDKFFDGQKDPLTLDYLRNF